MIAAGSGHKAIYLQLQQTINKTPRKEIKWCLVLHMGQSPDLWKLVNKICFCILLDNEYIWLVLHQILDVRELLVKMKIPDSNQRRLYIQS